MTITMRFDFLDLNLHFSFCGPDLYRAPYVGTYTYHSLFQCILVYIHVARLILKLLQGELLTKVSRVSIDGFINSSNNSLTGDSTNLDKYVLVSIDGVVHGILDEIMGPFCHC